MIYRICKGSLNAKLKHDSIENFLLKFISLIHGRTLIKKGCKFECETEIGDCCEIMGLHAKGYAPLKIGAYSSIGEGVKIITTNHETNCMTVNSTLQKAMYGHRVISSKSGVRIGSDAWIGDNAIILPGVIVGDGAVIGAGAVVTKCVERFSIVGGVPARRIKSRFTPQELIEYKAYWRIP